jgi:hypothetical protein
MTDQPQDEWGPWIEHDGASIPAEFRVGDVVQLLSENNETGGLDLSPPKVVLPDDFVRYNWFWGESTHDVLRYRIRKPRGMAILEQALADIPKKVQA